VLCRDFCPAVNGAALRLTRWNRRSFKVLADRHLSFINPLRGYHIVHLATTATGVAVTC
jgi:hypothetical protein